MDMARTALNVIGNALAALVIAKWEGLYDAEKGRRLLGSPAAPEEHRQGRGASSGHPAVKPCATEWLASVRTEPALCRAPSFQPA